MEISSILDFLYSRLDEINDLPMYERNDFVMGEVYAYVECLEFILSPTVSTDEILEIERKYGII